MKNFLTFLTQKSKLLKKPTGILCSLSGGQDSIVSFFLLVHLKQKNLFNIELIYCQHFWQTKNFFTPRLIFKFGFFFEIPCNIILPYDILLTENRSRDWRKKNFERVSKIENTTKLVTGQTVTDLIENYFTSLLRGTSPKSLCASNLLNYKQTTTLFFSNIVIKPNFYTYKVYSKISFILPKHCKFTSSLDCTNNLTFQTQIKKTRLKKYFHFSKTKKVRIITFRNQKIRTASGPKFLNFGNNSLPKTTNFGKNTTKFNFSYLTKKELQRQLIKNFLSHKNRTSSSFCIYSELVPLKINLIKPLQEKTRFTISKIIALYHFPIVNDVTNFSSDFSRNRIRYQLFPIIRFLLKKNFEILIFNFLRTLNREQKILENEILQVLFIVKIQKLINTNNLSLTLHHFYLKTGTRETSPFPSSEKRIAATNQNLFWSLQRLFLQKLFYQYIEIELTYFQILFLENFVFGDQNMF